MNSVTALKLRIGPKKQVLLGLKLWLTTCEALNFRFSSDNLSKEAYR